MISIVRTFGAPVTDPHGNVAAKMSNRLTSGRVSAATVEVICQTVSSRSTSNSRSTWTLPNRATRPRSLRSRSTIITFSARSLPEDSSRSRSRESSCSQRPRAMVPFMGRLSMRRPSQRKNSSGDADTTVWRPGLEKGVVATPLGGQ